MPTVLGIIAVDWVIQPLSVVLCECGGADELPASSCAADSGEQVFVVCGCSVAGGKSAFSCAASYCSSDQVHVTTSLLYVNQLISLIVNRMF